MRKIAFLLLILLITFLTGCNTSHNFMDVDNPNAKDDLKNLIGSGNIPDIKTNNIIPDSLSGTRKEARGYANKYYKDTLEEYVDIAKEGLSGAKESLKGYYNEGVDEINGTISNKVTGAISGELNKFKIK